MTRDGASEARETEKLLREINIVLGRRGSRELRRFGLTPSQFFTLLHIHRCRNPNMSTLCRRMSLSSATMSGIVDRLKEKGIITRERDEEDRRMIRLHLSEEGREILRSAYALRLDQIGNGLSGMNAEERRQFITLLARFRNSLPKKDETRADPPHKPHRDPSRDEGPPPTNA